jgi:hypothetical protein
LNNLNENDYVHHFDAETWGRPSILKKKIKWALLTEMARKRFPEDVRMAQTTAMAA